MEATWNLAPTLSYLPSFAICVAATVAVCAAVGTVLHRRWVAQVEGRRLSYGAEQRWQGFRDGAAEVRAEQANRDADREQVYVQATIGTKGLHRFGVRTGQDGRGDFLAGDNPQGHQTEDEALAAARRLFAARPIFIRRER